MSGFSSKPNDILNTQGCRESPENGNSCTSVIGKCTFYGSDEVDFDNVKETADDSLMYAMANDEFIHIDKSIVKINYVPYVEPQPEIIVRVNDIMPESNDSGSGGFNKNYLACIPVGFICFIIIFFIARRRVRSRLENDTDDLEWDEVDWKDNKLERLSTGDDSVRSDVTPSTSEGDYQSDLINLDDPEIFLQRTITSNGFEVRFAQSKDDVFVDEI